MIVNAPALKAIFVNLKTTFNNAFDAAPSSWQKIAMLVPSGTKTNDYKWLSNFPRMQKWIGEKAVKSLAGFSYTITNDDWEATVEVDRNDIEDDQLGVYAPQAQMAGFSAKQLPDEIVYSLVNQGFASVCYDGQYFFDVDHAVNGASVSNKGTKKLSCVSQAAAMASYGSVRGLTMIRITAKVNGFRRAGLAHQASPTEHPNDTFTEAQLAQLLAEPMLVVEVLDDPEPAGGDKNPAAAPVVDAAVKTAAKPAAKPAAKSKAEGKSEADKYVAAGKAAQ
ncbi:Mu-like prophage major head subunit gpT family protein [Chitinibacter sp. GC72]|uniref:Mu-like prophage major head subunit gpT family protein n=1 Tax=Chitinibacter sp. GC72 TaxID=1526917 RepID=UPI0012FA733F|nr:Mu-like prophage major head subunit gpT family protein [Chitinibacter sp. GC72]